MHFIRIIALTCEHKSREHVFILPHLVFWFIMFIIWINTQSTLLKTKTEKLIIKFKIMLMFFYLHESL